MLIDVLNSIEQNLVYELVDTKDYLLLEDGGYFLFEDGSRFLLEVA